MSPLLAMLWLRIGNTCWNISTPAKFALALLAVGLQFLCLALSTHFVNGDGLVSMNWLVPAYFLLSIGELCLSPIGLAMITALAPENLKGMMMGVWFLSLSAAYAIGAYMSNLMSIPKAITDPHVIGKIYNTVFIRFGWIALIIGVMLMLLTPKLKKMMGNT